MKESRNPTAPIVLATCTEVAGREPDDLLVIQSLCELGFEALHVAWDDPIWDWSTVPLTVIRSTWDYPERRADFLAWAERLPRVLNPASVLRWNTDKHYLNELASAGLPVIPTRFLEKTDAFEPPRTPFVIKPAVSCSAKDTARYKPSDIIAASQHVQRLQAEGRTVMVQPYFSAIETEGEVSLIFIGGKYSHSIRRNAVLTDGEVRSLPADIQEYQATLGERTLAEQVLKIISKGLPELLYARIDLVGGPEGSPTILEVELTEPSLFLAYTENGADRLAGCIASVLRDGTVEG